MITLNRLAKQCLNNAKASGHVNDNSGMRSYLYRASVMVHRAFEDTKWSSGEIARWSEYEISVAHCIVWLVAFLQRLGCRDIEQLLKDVVAMGEDPLKKA